MSPNPKHKTAKPGSGCNTTKPPPASNSDAPSTPAAATGKSATSTKKKKAASSKQPAAPPQPDVAALLRDLVARANAGEGWAIQRLRRVLDDNPRFATRVGDLTAIAEASWIALMTGSDQLATEGTKRNLVALKDELRGPHPTPLEALLVDQVAVAWLGAQHAEIQAASPSSGSLDQASFKLKRAESCQKRLLSATKTLATIRTLLSKGLVPSNPLKLFAPDARTG